MLPIQYMQRMSIIRFVVIWVEQFVLLTYISFAVKRRLVYELNRHRFRVHVSDLLRLYAVMDVWSFTWIIISDNTNHIRAPMCRWQWRDASSRVWLARRPAARFERIIRLNLNSKDLQIASRTQSRAHRQSEQHRRQPYPYSGQLITWNDAPESNPPRTTWLRYEPQVSYNKIAKHITRNKSRK